MAWLILDRRACEISRNSWTCGEALWFSSRSLRSTTARVDREDGHGDREFGGGETGGSCGGQIVVVQSGPGQGGMGKRTPPRAALTFCRHRRPPGEPRRFHRLRQVAEGVRVLAVEVGRVDEPGPFRLLVRMCSQRRSGPATSQPQIQLSLRGRTFHEGCRCAPPDR